MLAMKLVARSALSRFVFESYDASQRHVSLRRPIGWLGMIKPEQSTVWALLASGYTIAAVSSSAARPAGTHSCSCSSGRSETVQLC